MFLVPSWNRFLMKLGHFIWLFIKNSLIYININTFLKKIYSSTCLIRIRSGPGKKFDLSGHNHFKGYGRLNRF